MDMSSQFSRDSGSDTDKAALVKQLSKSFHPDDLAWIDSPNIRVRRTAVRPSQIDWQNRESWTATHEPGKVKDTRKSIKHGDDKPVALVSRPHSDNRMVMDGHHHTEAYTQLIDSGTKNKHVAALRGRIPAYEITVPRTNGPWDELHSKQEHNKNA
jgi:hypothetical protein